MPAFSDKVEYIDPGRIVSDHTQTPEEESARPFRLVKYFSYSGFTVILGFTLVLTIFLSQQTKNMVLKRSNDYVLLMVENLNYQTFEYFVFPTLEKHGVIRLRETSQYQLLDKVVRNAIHSFGKVKRVNIYDFGGNVSYSTDNDLIGTKTPDQDSYLQALLQNKLTSKLITKPGQSLTRIDKEWTLRTYSPLRGKHPILGEGRYPVGVFEIFLDLTKEYNEITRFQYLSITISVVFAGILFFILRQILVRGERIIQQRNEERRRLEEKLHHAQRLANLGQMIAAVAHEIRNPLGIISSTGEILKNKIKTYEPKNRLAEVIVEESTRLNGIVTEFLDFARPQVPRPTTCRLEDILDKNIGYLTPTLEMGNIDVVRDYNGPESIQADPDLLYRAFLNILNNAVQAMPEGGRIRISTAKGFNSNGKRLEFAEVVIEDTGEGIDPDQAELLFRPFYTTKYQGSGLGLAIVRNIIEEHKGTVAMTPAPQGGTRLVIHLPVLEHADNKTGRVR